MAFTRVTSMHSAAGDKPQSKKHPFPDLIHLTPVGVTFSYAKTELHYSQILPYTNVKMGSNRSVFLNSHEAKCSTFNYLCLTH